MRVIPQEGSPKRGGPRQVPRSPPLKHTTEDVHRIKNRYKLFLSTASKVVTQWLTWCGRTTMSVSLSLLFLVTFDILLIHCCPLHSVKNWVQNVLFRFFCTPMYASQPWCNFRKSCMQRLRVAYNFGCRALYNLPWRASVSSHQVQCYIPTFEALLRKYKYLFLERCRKSNNVWLRALMQSDCLYSSLFFEHYNRILLCEWVIELCSVRLIDGVSSHNAFAVYLD